MENTEHPKTPDDCSQDERRQFLRSKWGISNEPDPCNADACFGTRREWLKAKDGKSEEATVKVSELAEWLREKANQANAACEEALNEGVAFYYQGMRSAFIDARIKIETDADPGDAYPRKNNPNNPEVDYGDGKAMGINVKL